MIRAIKIIPRCIYKAAHNTVIHDGIEHAGYLAFLSMLAIFPFLVFFVALTGFIGETEFGTQLANLMVDHLPSDVIKALKPRIDEIVNGPTQGLLTLAILGTIWTASSTFEASRTALNKAYKVSTPPAYIWRRLLSIGQFLIFTGLLVIAMFLVLFSPSIWHQVEAFLGQQGLLDPIWTYTRLALAAGIVFLTIASSYYVLPNIKQRWILVAPGALIVAVLWTIAAYIFGQYIGSVRQVNIVYGSLGGVIIALLFFYVLGVIYIFGAEFNYIYERALGHRFEQKEAVDKTKKRRKTIDVSS